MALSSRLVRPGLLRSAGERAPEGVTKAGVAEHRPINEAWRQWERLRAFDRRFATAVDVALAAGLFVLCSGWIIERTATRPSLWVVAALTFPLAFRRRAPMEVFLVIAAVAFVQWTVTAPGLADAALLVALYTVALECAWPSVLGASLIMEAGVVLATVRWVPTGNHVKSFVFLTGLAFCALLAGVVVRALGSRLDWLAERAERLEIERDQQASLAAAAERARIAREMHDVVSHNLAVMVTLADAASAAQSTDPGRAAEVIREVSSTGRQALTDMRRMLGVLHEGTTPSPPASTPASVPLAPQPGLGELDALAERVCGTGLPVRVARTGRPFAVTDAAGLTVYRIVQEALTNTLKHAHATSSVEVLLEYDDPDISVRVTDDGLAHSGAFGPNAPALVANGSHRNGSHRNGSAPGGGGGHGVAGMTERAAAFGGTLRAGPRAGGGWEVAARLRDCKMPAPA